MADNKFHITLSHKETIAEDTMAFYWDKPEGFTYTAGQFGVFTQINPPETDKEGPMHEFTLASAPYEDKLMFATRMRDTAFKRVLQHMEPGSAIELEGPYGDFIVHPNTTAPIVFLTGGIGITPARSIIDQSTHDRSSQQLILFYANKTKADAAFLAELENWQQQNANFTFVPIMTRDESWQGENGHLSTEMLTKYVSDLATPLYYLSGPMQMIVSMRHVLTEAGIDKKQIRTEEFPRY